MKKLKLILVSLLSLTIIISCEKDDKDDDNNNDNNPSGNLDIEAISAKWVTDGTSNYESFEFNNSGNYIIVQNDPMGKSTDEQIILFGTFEITGNKTIVLSDFGTITVSQISANAFSFTVVLNSDPGNEIFIITSKEEEMPNTARTVLLCKTWELLTIDGESVAGTDMELTVLFSAAGTYLVTYPENSYVGGLAQWQWKDESEAQLLYTWDGYWSDDDIVDIPVLTSNSLEIVEDGTSYVLQPISNLKSAILKSSNVNKKTSNRFFNN